MIVHSATPDTCSDPSTCGVRCIDCNERMCRDWGLEPAPRCPDHRCCVDCADVVACSECALVLAEAAQDYADDRAYEIARDVS